MTALPAAFFALSEKRKIVFISIANLAAAFLPQQGYGPGQDDWHGHPDGVMHW
jgi:hypothetical protein